MFSANNKEVSNFVVLAGERFTSAFLEKITSPVSISIVIAEPPIICGASNSDAKALILPVKGRIKVKQSNKTIPLKNFFVI